MLPGQNEKGSTMSVDYCVVSIGTLSHNKLWGENVPVRTAHATTTLVRDGKRAILVDPSLPVAALAARLGERTGLAVSAVTDVFCTTLRPVHRRSITALAHANWWVHEAELETYAEHLKGAGLVLCLGSMLHSIATGNMLPSWVKIVCVDINPAVATKVSDRGTGQAVGVVADVGMFLDLLAKNMVQP